MLLLYRSIAYAKDLERFKGIKITATIINKKEPVVNILIIL